MKKKKRWYRVTNPNTKNKWWIDTAMTLLDAKNKATYFFHNKVVGARERYEVYRGMLILRRTCGGDRQSVIYAMCHEKRHSCHCYFQGIGCFDTNKAAMKFIDGVLDKGEWERD